MTLALLITLPPPQFACSHVLTTGIKVSKQYWYWVLQLIKVLPISNTTQYWKILGNTQYPNANIVLTLDYLPGNQSRRAYWAA